MLSTNAIEETQIMTQLKTMTYAANQYTARKLTKPFDESLRLIPPNVPGEAYDVSELKILDNDSWRVTHNTRNKKACK